VIETSLRGRSNDSLIWAYLWAQHSSALNSTSKAQSAPADIVAWTNSAAPVATESPFEPVMHSGITRHISQSNNVSIFPGV
jgi:hypothetical protein